MLYFNLYRAPGGHYFLGNEFHSEADAKRLAATGCGGEYVRTCAIAVSAEGGL